MTLLFWELTKLHLQNFLLMVVPLIFGKVLKDILSGDIISESVSYGPLFLGFSAAFITELFACKWMISLVKASNLKYFSFYCFIALFNNYLEIS